MENDYDFYKTMMQENLSHARHVENERMSLAMGMTGLVSGLWAVGGAAIADGIAKRKWEQIAAMLVICVIVFFALKIAIAMTDRWNCAFDNHWKAAEECSRELNKRGMFPFGENTGKTKGNFAKLYRVLTVSVGILFCALVAGLCVIIL